LSQATKLKMFRAARLELDEPNPYLMVNRNYVAIEGEGTTIGQAKWFFRTQGCSVGCKWCDSRQTWRFDLELNDWRQNSHSMFKIEQNELEEFVEHMINLEPTIRHISLTGGEPLQQNPEIIQEFIEILLKHQFTIQVETSGQLCDKQTMNHLGKIAEAGGIISVDLKTPSSGVEPNIEVLDAIMTAPWTNRHSVQVKSVNMIGDQIDYNFIQAHYNRWVDMGSKATMIITPCWSVGKEANISQEWIQTFLDDKDWLIMPKVILQQHKVIYGTDVEDS
jgi:organic radical activating enzyme